MASTGRKGAAADLIGKATTEDKCQQDNFQIIPENLYNFLEGGNNFQLQNSIDPQKTFYLNQISLRFLKIELACMVVQWKRLLRRGTVKSMAIPCA